MKRFTVVSVFVAVLVGAAATSGLWGRQTSAEPATLVLRNGRIATMDGKRPDAQALAARGDTIVAVGTDAEIAKLVGPSTQVIDLQGQFAMPGFIEGHGHFMGVGQARMSLNLMNIKTWDEAVAMVDDAVKKAKPGEWIVGRGWHQEKWSAPPRPNVEGFPTHQSLSAVSPNNPVLLTHASGHASFANARAMEVAGVTRDTPNPPGGEVLKDATGAPIGVFRETASGLIGRALGEWRRTLTPEQLETEARRQLTLAVEETLAKGITSFHDAGVPFDAVDRYKKAVDEGRLGLRLYVMVRAGVEELSRKLAS